MTGGKCHGRILALLRRQTQKCIDLLRIQWCWHWQLVMHFSARRARQVTEPVQAKRMALGLASGEGHHDLKWTLDQEL